MSSSKTITLEDCQKHTTEDSCWLIIDGKVYDVTKFLDEHPGGYDIIITNTGKDATSDFDEIGHSRAAKELLDKYLIGNFEGGAVAAKQIHKVPLTRTTQQGSLTSSIIKALFPLLVILLAVLYNYYK